MSTSEWIASDSMADDPVQAKATNFDAAIARLQPSATRTTPVDPPADTGGSPLRDFERCTRPGVRANLEKRPRFDLMWFKRVAMNRLSFPSWPRGVQGQTLRV